MNTSALKAVKRALELKESELELNVRNREGMTIEQTADSFDRVQHAAERELVIRNLDREFRLLRNVRAALLRIDEGRFGTCVGCEGDITLSRLAAVPWTSYCIGCQQMADEYRVFETVISDNL